MAPDDEKARATLLDETRWANDFAWAEIESLAAHLRVERRAKGDRVCREGDRDPSLFIIAKGSVAIVKQDAGDEERFLARLGPGQTIGEMALLDGQPRSASAVAAEDLVLLVFARAELDRLVEEKPRLGVKLLWKLARFLSQRLRQTSGALAERLGSA
jgi:CRP-like cAMP-binding protein